MCFIGFVLSPYFGKWSIECKMQKNMYFINNLKLFNVPGFIQHRTIGHPIYLWN